MKAMFVIPTLISEYVPEKLVPLIGKLIERNIAVNYRNVLQQAISIIRGKQSNIKNINITNENLGVFDLYKTILNEAPADKISAYKQKLADLKNDKINVTWKFGASQAVVQRLESRLEAARIELDIRNKELINVQQNPKRKNNPPISALISAIRDQQYEVGNRLKEFQNKQKEISDIQQKINDISDAEDKYIDLLSDAESEATTEIQAKIEKSEKSEDRTITNRIRLDNEQDRKEDRPISNKIRLDTEKDRKEKHQLEKKEKIQAQMDKIFKTDDETAKGGFVKPDAIDVPRGIYFYKDIGLEPTFIQIVFDGTEYLVGLKCIPYKLEKTEDTLIKMMQLGRATPVSQLKRVVISLWNSFIKKLPGVAGYVAQGRPVSGLASAVGGGLLKAPLPGEEPLVDIEYTPSLYELSNPKFLASKIRRVGEISSWATAMVITEKDIENADIDMDHFFKIYKNLAKVGWGDVLILNTAQEVLHHCNLTLLSCTKIPISYLQKLFNIEGVLDFAELSKHAKGPFAANSKPMASFAKEFDSRG